MLCTHIAQTGPQKEALSTDALASFLGISQGKGFFFADFDLTQSQERLLAYPIIEKVNLAKEKEGILLVDYTLRTPIAFLGDFSNLALDRGGHIFPFFPFFTPKELPSFYLGLTHISQNDPNTQSAARLKGHKIQLAFALFDVLEATFPCRFPIVVSIDVSKAYQPFLGQREIIVTLKTKEKKVHYLRLTPERYLDEIQRYESIQEQWQGNLTFDLRIDQLALIQKNAQFTESSL